MNNRFITKKKKRKSIRKIFFLFIMLIIGIYISLYKLDNSKLKIKDKEFINIIVNSTFNDNNYLIEKLINKTLEVSNPLKLMNKNYNEYISKNNSILKEEVNPIIYLYNTHQTEEYASSNYAEFSVNPTVIMNNYILEDIFNKRGYQTIVEEESIKEILTTNNWNYSNSYKASRILLDNSIHKYPSLKYFIDIHRDSLEKDKTTIIINDKSYAKILFIVGLDNTKYQDNLSFTLKINNKLNEKYPNLSKGIYKKSGAGVNGIYNQDFSPKTILIEIGGYQNTTSEVLNSALAFGDCFLEVINEEDN